MVIHQRAMMIRPGRSDRTWKSLAAGNGNRLPRLPDGVRIYAIGDIHGRADLLAEMLSRIEAHLVDDPVPRSIHVLLGDYIDRGPASRDVIDRLVELRCAHEAVLLKGNHETYLAKFLRDPSVLTLWRHYGGLTTLMSYGLKPSMSAGPAPQRELADALDRLLPDNHRALLDSLSLSFTCGDFFFAHAGVRPGIALHEQCEEDLLWIRDEFLPCADDFGKVVVHGHTPVPEPEIRPNRINIDTGAYATGRLTCVAIQGDAILLV